MQDEEKIKKAVYQSIADFANDLRKDVKIYFSERENWVNGAPYTFKDVFYKHEFADLLFKYLADEIDKETFKRTIEAKIAYVHAPYVQNNRILKPNVYLEDVSVV